MTTTDATKLQITIGSLRADVAIRERTIKTLETKVDELREELRCRDTEVEELLLELRCRDTDELTGMHNLRWLREWWASLRRPAETIASVAFIDIDCLKRVNDSYGHRMGDRVITHVAAVLISSGCYGVRYGGDEFLLFVPAGRSAAMALDGIAADIASHPVPTPDGPITVTVSYGARVVDDGMDLWQLIHDADIAMYDAKRVRPRCQTIR